jgi:hypothetical protein
LTEIQLIDEHMSGHQPTENRLLFDALLIINPELSNNVLLQKRAHTLVQQYGRKQLKAEIENVHRQLFSSPEHQSFRQKILNLFNNR